MEPSEAVVSAETALREAVRLVLPAWLASPGAPPAEALQDKRREEVKKRDGIRVGEDLLAYTETRHLMDLIVKNWEPFKPVFDDLSRTKTYLAVLLDYRNAVAHSRELVGFERDLLAGVSGQLRNQVALFRTRNEPSSAHYPLIEAVTDNFGQKLWTEAARFTPREPIRLNIGERLQFRCRGWDSQERPLTWRFYATRNLLYSDCPAPLVTIQGRQVTFAVKVGQEWVTEQIEVCISLASSGRYHRVTGGGYDDQVFAQYAVNPPRDS